jgi:guanylate kinase
MNWKKLKNKSPTSSDRIFKLFVMHHDSGKLIIITAPSGAGKTTIVRHLLQTFPQLAFSVSATSRSRRPAEVDGRDYYFIGVDEFRLRIGQGEFLEWEEVYPGQFYGTLHSELQRLWLEGKHIVFDIDVKGAINLQKAYPYKTLSIFVKPPSPEVLYDRLRGRRTESAESLHKRINKADYELSFEPHFDRVLINDVLEITLQQAEDMVQAFLQPGAHS